MNKYVIVFIVLFFITLCTTIGIQYNSIKNLKQSNELLYNNNSAYEQELYALQDSFSIERGVYLYNIDYINNSKDSVIRELNKIRKEANIKDNKVKELTNILSEIKTDTTINITNIITDSCEFDIEIKYNDQTIFNLSNKRINGVDSLHHNSDISASFNGINYIKSEGKEPKFFKRLIKFKGGKYYTERYILLSDNDKVRIKNYKVIKIKE